ncbi:hypothetical protein ESCAB7627_1503 [Escherichia albertii TW07627]|uniref:Uncharacterized protein n=1 Tax=Escherichia albertii (strain TW07627) TaxID=502347 RepID=A0ABC9NR47_ESCAT|nr:hypothetical protein ESCAB7627_1503 [Escherichia albertii TW07627]
MFYIAIHSWELKNISIQHSVNKDYKNLQAPGLHFSEITLEFFYLKLK